MTPEQSIKYLKDHYGNNYANTVSSSVIPSNLYNTMYNTIYGSYARGGIVHSGTNVALGPGVVEQVLKEMITQYKAGDPLVICVDNDFDQQQMKDLARTLASENIKGVLISGARAGTGRTIHRDLKDQYQMIDVLGRIAVVWREHPDLHLTDLLGWYKGELLDDDVFAAAVDVYVRKVYG